MDHVYIYSSLDLARHWRPLGESYDWTYDSEPRPDASVTFALPDGDPRTNHRSHYISLLVAESPLKQQTYDLVVESNDFVAPPPSTIPLGKDTKSVLQTDARQEDRVDNDDSSLPADSALRHISASGAHA